MAVIEQSLSTWSITSTNIDPHSYFGAMVANGMVGLISDAQPMHIKETILNGVFDRYQRGRVSNILKGFNALNIDLMVNGVGITLDSIREYSQTLDFKNACLVTRFKVGKSVSITYQLMALRSMPYTVLANLKIDAHENVSCTIANNVSAPDHLRDVKNLYSEIDRPHARIPLLTSVAKSPSGIVELAVSNSYLFNQSHLDIPVLIHEDWDFNRHLIKFTTPVSKGESFDFSIISSSCTSVHFSDPQNEAERLSIYAKLEGKDRLISRHLSEWSDLWKSDIIIEGDDQTQRDIRLMIYYLYSSIREGSGLSLSPVGLSGLGYNGHVFWDTELWMYPALLVLNPDLARSILDYRVDRISAAVKNAFSHGFRGAMFPWESADDGTEQTPVWALTGPFQQHITACVGWAFWKYFQVTQDKEWLKAKGFPLLKLVAEFWCSRVERNHPDKFDINNVIGANEFEENIDNNAFTNGIVKTVLINTHQAALVLGEEINPDWLYVSDRIPVLSFDDGVTKENETYSGAEIKQADVNLLAHPLSLIEDVDQIRKDLDYYEPRMSSEGPAMGVSTLTTLRSKVGDVEHAYQLLHKSYKTHGLPPFGVLAECAGGKGVSPYFLTGAGGVLQSILFGFGGLQITDTGIVKREQKLPKKWSELVITSSVIQTG